MDELIEVLNGRVEIEDGRPSFEVVNTSRVIRVTAATRDDFDNPESAYAAAREMVSALLVTGLKPVNSAEIGAFCSTWPTRERWRGRIRIALWPSDDLDEDHETVPGLSM